MAAAATGIIERQTLGGAAQVAAAWLGDDAAAVAIVGFVGPPIKARKRQDAIQKRHQERQKHEATLSAEGAARRVAEADELAARILGLREVYERGVELVVPASVPKAMAYVPHSC